MGKGVTSTHFAPALSQPCGGGVQPRVRNTAPLHVKIPPGTLVPGPSPWSLRPGPWSLHVPGPTRAWSEFGLLELWAGAKFETQFRPLKNMSRGDLGPRVRKTCYSRGGTCSSRGNLGPSSGVVGNEFLEGWNLLLEEGLGPVTRHRDEGTRPETLMVAGPKWSKLN